MEKLTARDDEVVSDDLSAMVWTLPRHCVTLIKSDLRPDESRHVQLINCVQFFFVDGSAPEQQQRMFMLIVIKSEIRARRRQLTLLVHLFECERGQIEPPEIVIVLGIYMDLIVLSYPPKTYTWFWIETMECPQREHGDSSQLTVLMF